MQQLTPANLSISSPESCEMNLMFHVYDNKFMMNDGQLK